MATAKPERRSELLMAAVQVFARYGYRKTSMDEVARVAGLSRQGLYLYFPTKEALFRDGVRHVLEIHLADARAALDDETQPIVIRVGAAFDAWHGPFVATRTSGAHLSELLDAARSMVGELIDRHDAAFIDALAAVLDRGGAAALHADIGLSADDLAHTLVAASRGLKHHVESQDDYIERMGLAISIVCRCPTGARRAQS